MKGEQSVSEVTPNQVPSSPEGAFFDPQLLLGNVILEQAKTFGLDTDWPDIAFEISDQNMVDSDLLHATTTSRLRTLMFRLEEETPTAVHRPDGETVSQGLRTMHNYLTKEVKINGAALPRYVLLNTNAVVEKLSNVYEKHNYPVSQLLNQVNQKYGNRLSPHEIDELQTSLVLCSQQTLVVNIYRDYISQFRKLATFTDSGLSGAA